MLRLWLTCYIRFCWFCSCDCDVVVVLFICFGRIVIFECGFRGLGLSGLGYAVMVY